MFRRLGYASLVAWCGAISIAVVLGATAPVAMADAPAADPVVARVGPVEIRASELQARLMSVPPFQLAAYGGTPAEIKRNFLSKVLIPELLMSVEAERTGVGSGPELDTRRRDMLKSAMLRELRNDWMQGGEVPEEEIRAFYAQNRDRYQTPERYSIWRILVATREEAEALIQQAQRDPSPKAWIDLARDRSLDKASSMRGGNLGFVGEDGVTNDRTTRVPALVVAAVKQVKDGEIVKEPVQEGSGWAVVWRRGSMPAVNRTFEQEAPTIRRTVARSRVLKGQQELIEQLREKHVRMINPDAVELLEVTSMGEVKPRTKPGRVDPRRGAGAPTPTQRGLR